MRRIFLHLGAGFFDCIAAIGLVLDFPDLLSLAIRIDDIEFPVLQLFIGVGQDWRRKSPTLR